MTQTDPGRLPDGRYHPMLTGQKALVTGAASGIGRAAVLGLARAGADVVVNYRRKADAAQEIVDEIRGLGRQAEAVQADVSDEVDVRGLFRRTTEILGAVDILVSNAGLQRDAPVHEMSLDQWQKVIDVNLTGQFLCCREAIQAFRRQGVRREVSVAAGKIVCMSSVHDVIPWAGRVNYAASKGGLLLLMKSLAQEVAPERIRVNAVSPGAIRTPINRESWEDEQAHASLMNLIPYKRIGEPDDVAQAVAWLASDAADYVNGVTLYVDGGMTLYPGFAGGG